MPEPEIAKFYPKYEPPGRILAICAGDQAGGPKKDVGQGQLTRNLGLNGDADALKRVLWLLAEEDYLSLKAQNPVLAYGATGENLVVSLSLASLAPGRRLRSGDALIELGAREGPRLFRSKVVLDGIITVGDQIYAE
ncbi:MAG: hypothetical protein LBE01_01360 [Deltaproteobacteria bacterium]|jgi:hypothetical protein|nr:hypothetical protein [Deltaproteobacteria bacterium]